MTDGGAVRRLTVALALALALSGCGLAPWAPGPGLEADHERVGPRMELGPVPVHGLDGAVQDGGRMTYVRTRDGWCTESAGGGMCAGGGPPPDGFDGFGGSEDGQRTCVHTVTGKGVPALQVVAGDREPVRLRPLPGSEAAPANVFAACWEPPVPFDEIRAEPVG